MTLQKELEQRMELLGRDISGELRRLGCSEEDVRAWAIQYGILTAEIFTADEGDVFPKGLESALAASVAGGFLLGLDYADRHGTPAGGKKGGGAD